MNLLLIACLTFLSSMCFAQIAPISKLQTADGFVEVCGQPDSQPSRDQLATMKKSPPSQLADALRKAMDDRMAEEAMCIGYVAGLVEGWKEGHEHGVAAAQFPEGWPQDQEKALAALPLKQLQAANLAMNVDVPCVPDYITIGQERDILVKYIRSNPLLGAAMTHRVIWLAFQEAFPCKLHPK